MIVFIHLYLGIVYILGFNSMVYLFSVVILTEIAITTCIQSTPRYSVPGNNIYRLLLIVASDF
jgi:hypothetical protein